MDRTSTNKNYTFTANTKLGDLGLGAGYFNVKNEGATSINTYHIAASYPLAANLTLSGNYAENGTSGGSMALTNIGLQYNLSKSSFFYGTASHAKNGAFTTYSGANSIGVAGTSNNGFAVGLVKAF
jgi:predicted porin